MPVFRRAYTKKDYLIIKRKLGIPPHAPLPKCPAKNKSIIKGLEEMNDFSHSDFYPPDEYGQRLRKSGKDFHYPCEICGCHKTAGFKTRHLGWGWCNWHERGKRKGIAKRFAENHLQAFQQHNPGYYRTAEDVRNEIIQRGERANCFTGEGGSRTPYTAGELGQVPCFRCSRPSSQQWQICALDNYWFGVCAECDIELNEFVLLFMGFSEWETPQIMARYKPPKI